MIWTRSRRENKSDQMNSSLSCELFSDDGSPGDLGQASSGIQATHTSTPTSPTRNSNGIQMPTYKSFAVVGGGRIGLPIVSALASHGASVILLSWPGSAPKTVPSTVKVIQVDYNNVAATAAVFKNRETRRSETLCAFGDCDPNSRRCGCQQSSSSNWQKISDSKAPTVSFSFRVGPKLNENNNKRLKNRLNHFKPYF
jgi:hypothetical protein